MEAVARAMHVPVTMHVEVPGAVHVSVATNLHEQGAMRVSVAMNVYDQGPMRVSVSVAANVRVSVAANVRVDGAVVHRPRQPDLLGMPRGQVDVSDVFRAPPDPQPGEERRRHDHRRLEVAHDGDLGPNVDDDGRVPPLDRDDSGRGVELEVGRRERDERRVGFQVRRGRSDGTELERRTTPCRGRDLVDLNEVPRAVAIDIDPDRRVVGIEDHLELGSTFDVLALDERERGLEVEVRGGDGVGSHGGGLRHVRTSFDRHFGRRRVTTARRGESEQRGHEDAADFDFASHEGSTTATREFPSRATTMIGHDTRGSGRVAPIAAAARRRVLA